MRYTKKYIVLLRTSLVLLILLLLAAESTKCFRAVVPSGSMEPYIMVGDQLLAVKTPAADLHRGDIVIFYHDGTLYIKRLIGMPDEIIDIKEGTIFVNGEILNEPYVVNNDTYSGTFMIPSDSYLFLGDNRINSNDARYWKNPFVKSEDIKGRALFFIYPEYRKVKRVQYDI